MISNIFLLIHLLAFISLIFFIAKYIKLRRQKQNTKQVKKKILIVVVIWVVSFILFGVSSPSDNSKRLEPKDDRQKVSIDTKKHNKINDEEKENIRPKVESGKDINDKKTDELRKTLKKKYDISKPRKFTKGDATGKWRINVVSNSTSPSEYAVDYARAYMIPDAGDETSVVYYIVNHTLKTTTKFHITYNVLEVVTTEYINKEEHNASSIGQGQLLDEKFFDLETGEEIKKDIDPNVGFIDKDTFVKTIEKEISGSVGDGEKITNVTFDGRNLEIDVDISNASPTLLTPEDLAETRASSITDSILDLDDRYYNTWESITLNFKNIGDITFTKDDIKTNGFGMYFDVPIDLFKN